MRWQLPTVREDLRIEFPAHFGRRNVMGRPGSFLDEPIGNNLLIVPSPAAQHAVCNPGKVPGGHANAVRRVTPMLRISIQKLKRPMLNTDWSEERFNCELVVWPSCHKFAKESGVSKCVGRVTTSCSRIERQIYGARVTGMSNDILPGAVVGRAGRFGADA